MSELLNLAKNKYIKLYLTTLNNGVKNSMMNFYLKKIKLAKFLQKGVKDGNWHRYVYLRYVYIKTKYKV